MYPSRGNCKADLKGRVTLPDGREISVFQEGYIEGDTNAFVESGDAVVEWVETGEELTGDEFHQEIEFNGRTLLLHEYLWDFIKWDEQ